MSEAPAEPQRVLLVTRNFPPLLGGMESVNQHLLSELSLTSSTGLSGPAGARAQAGRVEAVVESPLKPLWKFLLACAWRTVRLSLKWRPHLVIAGSGVTAPIAYVAARCCGARAAVYLHGLDIIAPSWIYQRIWLPFIRRCDAVLVNSRHTAKLAERAGVSVSRIQVLHPGTDLPTLDRPAGDRFRKLYALGDAPLMLSVGRLTPRKGLVEFITQAMPSIIASCPSAVLVVIGDDAVDALNSKGGSERSRIFAAASSAGVGGALRMLGRCDGPTLEAAYDAASVHVFPVLELPGDVEGFGMVALESAAYSVATVAFAVGGVGDAVCDGVTGTLVIPGDYPTFGRRVVEQLNLPPKDAEAMHAFRAFAGRFEWSQFGEQLRAWAGSVIKS